MAGIKAIIGTFLPLGKTADSPQLSKPVEVIHSSGKNLMGIALVSHIPYQLILGQIQAMKKSDGQLHHPQIGGQMPPMHGGFFQNKASQLLGQGLLFGKGQPLYILRPMN